MFISRVASGYLIVRLMVKNFLINDSLLKRGNCPMYICRKNWIYQESEVSVKNMTILKACKAADFE